MDQPKTMDELIDLVHQAVYEVDAPPLRPKVAATAIRIAAMMAWATTAPIAVSQRAAGR